MVNREVLSYPCLTTFCEHQKLMMNMELTILYSRCCKHRINSISIYCLRFFQCVSTYFRPPWRKIHLFHHFLRRWHHGSWISNRQRYFVVYTAALKLESPLYFLPESIPKITYMYVLSHKSSNGIMLDFHISLGELGTLDHSSNKAIKVIDGMKIKKTTN